MLRVKTSFTCKQRTLGNWARKEAAQDTPSNGNFDLVDRKLQRTGCNYSRATPYTLVSCVLTWKYSGLESSPDFADSHTYACLLDPYVVGVVVAANILFSHATVRSQAGKRTSTSTINPRLKTLRLRLDLSARWNGNFLSFDGSQTLNYLSLSLPNVRYVERLLNFW